MKIVILGGHGEFVNIVYNHISAKYEIEKVILEHGVGASTLLKRRCKKLGVIKVIGQLLFKLYSEIVLKPTSSKRIHEILFENTINQSAVPQDKVIELNSVNSNECIELLKTISPDLIFVMGTQIISERVLLSVDSTFINMHMGITPLYRGVHGGYWALAENDPEHCGVTVHLVDKGIDTGGVISQAKIYPTAKDTFLTYPYLQLVEGIKLFLDVIDRFEKENLFVQKTNLPSKIWTHPTLGQYFKKYLQHGIK